MIAALIVSLAHARPPTYTLNGAAFPKVPGRASRLSTYSTASANVPVLFHRFRPPGGRAL